MKQEEEPITGLPENAFRELKPGEAAALKVNTKSGADAGKVTCLISVISNAPANPELTLRFYGNID